MDERLQRAPVGVLDVSPEGTVTAVNDAARRLLDAGDVSGAPLDEVAPRSVDDSLVAAFEGASVSESEFEEYYPDLDRWLAVSVVPGDGATTVYLRDVTARHRREASLARLRTERERTAVIDEALSEVLGDLVDASSRAEIAETVCRGLGESDRYEFSWVGERVPGSEGITVRAAAGETGETLGAVREALGGGETPAERAVETGRLQAVQPLAADAAVPESVRMAGFADGVQSVLAVPLAHGENVYGVVCVYASGTDAFSDRERTSFRMLGEVAGFAVTAVRNRSLLHSDAVTEVTFDVDGDSVLATLSGRLAAAVRLEGLVSQSDDATLCYVAVEGVSEADLAAVAADTRGVRRARVVSETASGGTLELAVCGPSPLLAVSSLGGTVRRATFEDGAGRLVVDLPRDGDARRMADAVSEDCGAEVVAKRGRERAVTTPRDLRDDARDRLTERQETALRTAYLADYFESPRGSTAEEVAASLDITGSTLLHHLRAGERKLLDALFDDGTGATE
jgi:predicted DNA binding protein